MTITKCHLSKAGLAALAVLAAPLAAEAGPLTLNVSGARSESGVIRCGLYASAAGFRDPARAAAEATGKISGGRATCAFKAVPAGTYAVAVFHAERSERNVETGMFGKPKQGVGFSRNPSISFGPPGFEAAAFSVDAAPKSMSINLVY